MLSRRAFVGAGATVAAWAASPAYTRQLRDLSTSTLPLRAVFDRTCREGIAFGAVAARRGAVVDVVGADLGSFWMQTLEPALKRGPLTLAGLTAGAPLFCLELLCRDYGLSTVYRIEHRLAPDGGIEHLVTGDAALAPWIHRLATTGAEWAAEAAALATTGATLPRPARPLELLDLGGGARQSLFTWVMQSDVGAASAAIFRSRG